MENRRLEGCEDVDQSAADLSNRTWIHGQCRSEPAKNASPESITFIRGETQFFASVTICKDLLATDPTRLLINGEARGLACENLVFTL